MSRIKWIILIGCYTLWYWWVGFVDEMRWYVDYKLLAITSGFSISIKSSYIVFLTKMQKRQTPQKEFAFLISENTSCLKLCWALIYCRYHRFAWSYRKNWKRSSLCALLTYHKVGSFSDLSLGHKIFRIA